MKTKFFYGFLSVLFLVFVSQLTFGAPPTSFYTPGETDDPSCIPGTANCDVTLDGLDTDDQTLSLSGSSLSIQDGNTIVLPSVVDTDDQSLTLSGASLSIDDGNTLDLSSIGSFLTTTWSNITGIPADIADGDDDTQLTEVQVDAFVSNNGYLTGELDGSVTNEIQNLSLSGTTISISDGTGVDIGSVLEPNLNIYNSNGTIGAGRTVGVTDTVNFDNSTLFVDGVNNSIGIGTITPERKLHVEGGGISLDPVGGRTGQLFNGTSSQDGSEINTITNGYAALQRSNVNANLSLSKNSSLGVSTGQFLNMVSDNNIIGSFTTGNGVDLGINVNRGGNVGIGTDAPLSKFQVDAASGFARDWQIRVNDSRSSAGFDTGAVSKAIVIASDGDDIAGIGAVSPSSGGEYLWFSAHDGTTVPAGSAAQMFLRNGNLGIGISNPASKLSVVGLPSGTTDAVVSGDLAGAVCITTSGNMYIDTDGTCAN